MSKNNEDQQKLDRRSFLKFSTLLPAAGLVLPTLRAAESCQSTMVEFWVSTALRV